MPPAFVQFNQLDQPGGGTSPFSIAFSSNNTLGNLLIFVCRTSASNPTAITDTQGNAWINGTPLSNIPFWYAPNCKAGANTVSITNGATGLQAVIAEYSGVATSNPLDACAFTAATGTGTSAVSNSITTTFNGDLILGFGYNSTTNSPALTAGAGFTLRSGAIFNSFLEDMVQSSLGAITSTTTYGASVTWAQAVAAFRPAGTGGSIAFVQGHNQTYASLTAFTNTFSSNTTAGNMLVALSNYQDIANSATIADTLNNSWTPIFVRTTVIGGAQSALGWFCPSSVGGADTITVTKAGAAANGGVVIAEYSGVNTVDRVATVLNATAATWTSNPITTTQPLELLVAWGIQAGGGVLAFAPFNTRNTIGNFATMGDEIVGTTGTYTASFSGTASQSAAAFLFSFYQASGGGGAGEGYWTQRHRRFVNKR